MFRRWLNRATVRIAISPRGPILIKSGLESADPTRPAMEFVRSRHGVLGETVYIPGTSLKGALRSQAERVLLGLGIDQVCDPFNKWSPCSREGRGTQPPLTSAQVFSRQCPACQTFGSLSVAGRCSLDDAYPSAGGAAADYAAANTTETRWQVGIDRRTGQAQNSALFDLEVVVAGAFHTTLHLENFQLWQLGLMGALLADMDQGDVPIGFGKSRGLGQVSVAVEGIDAEMLGRGSRRLEGAGALCPPDEADAYGLVRGDTMELPDGAVLAPTWRGRRVSAAGDLARALLGAAMDGPLREWLDSKKKPLEQRA